MEPRELEQWKSSNFTQTEEQQLHDGSAQWRCSHTPEDEDAGMPREGAVVRLSLLAVEEAEA